MRGVSEEVHGKGSQRGSAHGGLGEFDEDFFADALGRTSRGRGLHGVPARCIDGGVEFRGVDAIIGLPADYGQAGRGLVLVGEGEVDPGVDGLALVVGEADLDVNVFALGLGGKVLAFRGLVFEGQEKGQGRIVVEVEGDVLQAARGVRSHAQLFLAVHGFKGVVAFLVGDVGLV